MNLYIKALSCCMVAMLWGCLLYAQPNITRVEYYIDSDPGYGKAISANTPSATNLSNISLNIDPATLSTGVHILGIRARDVNGAWSLDNRWVFAKPYASDTTKARPVPKVSKIEYYIDNDPGYNKATPVTITPSTNLSNLTINVDPTKLSEGVHIFYIRARDENGNWSLDTRWLFARPYASDTTNQGPTPTLKQAEYYIDTDPGYGKGTPIAIENATNLANINLSVNISNLETGNHTIYIRSKDIKNSWSLDNKFNFNVSAKVAAPSITVNSISKKTLCTGDVFSVGFDVKGTFSAGNVFTVQLSNGTGSFAAPVNIGSITGTTSGIIQCTLPNTLASGTNYLVRVVSKTPALTSSTGTDKLSIATKPAKPTISSSGSTTICQGSSIKLTSSLATSYKWNTGATTQSISVSQSGKYAVTVTNANGCTANSDTTVVSYTSCGNPAGLTVSSVTSSSALLKWKKVPCATGYKVQYKKNGTTAWTTVSKIDTSITITGLTPGTTYNWSVQTVCTSSSSNFSNGPNFTTSASLIASSASKSMQTQSKFDATVYPNPASTSAVLSLAGTYKPVTVTLSDFTGKVLWRTSNVVSTRVDLPVANLNAAVYIITVTDGNETKILKLIKGQQ